MTTRPSTPGRYRSQRVLDLVVIGVSAPITMPIMLIVGVAIRCTGPGVLFRQQRIGRHGRPFTLLKFRTMTPADDQSVVRLPDAANVTSVGRVVRRFSLDELPQIFNILRGEMSVVGPRPTMAYQVDRYDDRQRRRLEVRPGLTGLAQIEGRNAIDWQDRIEFDLHYVDQRSLGADLRIIARTLGAVVRGTGVGGHSATDPLSRPEVGG